MSERLTDAQHTAIVAHFSYELEPITPLPDWNAVAMETVHLRNEITALRAALDAAESRAVGVRELVWECTGWSSGDGVRGENDDTWEATSPADEIPYCIEWLGGGNFLVSPPVGKMFYEKSLQAAKDAAQSIENARIGKCLSALHPASPLGAVVMREKAARIAEDRNDEIWDIYTGEKVGLDGCAEKIRAIPLPTDDELFAAAAELLAKHFASLSPEELGRFELAVEIDGAIAALAPFTRKGE